MRVLQELRAAGLIKLANEVQLAKASKFLTNKDFEMAITIFKEFEKKSNKASAGCREQANGAEASIVDTSRASSGKCRRKQLLDRMLYRQVQSTPYVWNK